MIEMRFVDTNVFLYRASRNPHEAAKTERAKEILRSGDLATSVQAMQEFYVQATRKTRADRLSHEHATAMIAVFCRFPVQEMTVPLLEAALRTTQRYGISYWDAAIIEAARALECDIVLSEDLSGTQDYGGVRVVNPFKE